MRSSVLCPALLWVAISLAAALVCVRAAPQPPAAPLTRSLQDDANEAAEGPAAAEQDSGEKEQVPTSAQGNTTRPANDTASEDPEYEQEPFGPCDSDDDCATDKGFVCGETETEPRRCRRLRCDDDADCSKLAELLSCQRGRCRPPRGRRAMWRG
ncbi:unnamed protein product [Vitrella brassicaformis CCMP3155]|uniref:Dickkopf N-terminal cysteine-rich domain-containing protein n=2 Tax=Vitrella brassicaformis TaxID=1169539 RepID=A0A0G4GEY8_VITBC|nr:unnamed protein product [Vitrella brassicaformis CCMP3155]|eukprot:CEM28070.1 unnamed protein product [Vitrella brassicaformis CCMP3155]